MQNHPNGDATIGFLRSQPTTGAVLAAIRRAHTARQNMMQGKGPVERATLSIVPPDATRYADYCQALPIRVAFSACGAHLAVSMLGFHPAMQGEETKPWAPWRGLPPVQDRSQLVMHHVGQRIELGMWLRNACCLPAFAWAPDAPHLSIVAYRACEQNDEAQPSPPEVVASVFDATTGSRVHQFGQVCLGRLITLWQESHTHHEWSASGRYLLVTGHATLKTRHWGDLVLFDVWKDCILAESAFCVTSRCTSVLAAVWHPHSQAIVLSCSVQLQQPETFIAAGFAVGSLPDRCFVRNFWGAKFSPDGCLFAAKLVAAAGEVGDGDSETASTQHNPNTSILSCLIQEGNVSFIPLHDLRADSSHWMSCSSRLICHFHPPWPRRENDERSSVIWEFLSDQIRALSIQGKPMLRPVASHASKLMAEVRDVDDQGRSRRGLCFVDIGTGEQVWADDHCEPQPCIAAAFSPSGCKVLYVERLTAGSHAQGFSDRFHIKLLSFV